MQRQPDTASRQAAYRGQAAARRGQSLHRRDRVRLRADSYCRHADGARCVARFRRSHRESCSTRSAISGARLYFATNPAVRSWMDCVRQRAAQYRLGRHLGRSNDPHEQRLDGGVCHSFKSLSFFPSDRASGASTSLEPSRARSRTIAGRAPRSTRSFFRYRSRENHEPRRAHAGIGLDLRPFLAGDGSTSRAATTMTSVASPDSTSSTASRRA